jgi:hypothetical protein
MHACPFCVYHITSRTYIRGITWNLYIIWYVKLYRVPHRVEKLRHESVPSFIIQIFQRRNVTLHTEPHSILFVVAYRVCNNWIFFAHVKLGVHQFVVNGREAATWKLLQFEHVQWRFQWKIIIRENIFTKVVC